MCVLIFSTNLSKKFTMETFNSIKWEKRFTHEYMHRIRWHWRVDTYVYVWQLSIHVYMKWRLYTLWRWILSTYVLRVSIFQKHAPERGNCGMQQHQISRDHSVVTC